MDAFRVRYKNVLNFQVYSNMSVIIINAWLLFAHEYFVVSVEFDGKYRKFTELFPISTLHMESVII